MTQNPTGNQAGSFIWYELMTTDPVGAKAFYDAVVGWTIEAQPASDTAGVDYRFIMRADGCLNGGVLALTPEMCAEGAAPCWMGYIHVADVDSAANAIAAEGGSTLIPPTDIPQTGRFAMVTDPQGVPIYIMTPAPPPGHEERSSDVFDRETPQHVSWNELLTDDLDAAKAFYSRNFGFEFNSSMPMGELGEYCFIDHGGQTIGAMMQRPQFVPRSGWNYYLRVDSIVRAKAAAVAGGGTIYFGPQEVPGGDWIVNGIDPQGAPFALVGAKGE